MRRLKPRAGHRMKWRKLLATRWGELNRADLEVHLRFLILAEHRTRPTHSDFDPSLPAYRFRARRVEVAKRFIALGGRVSRCVASGALPPPRRWPGVVCLVETKGFQLFGGVVDASVA
jgi:hypothetical protein